MFKGLVAGLGQGVGAWLQNSLLTGPLTQTSSTTIGRGQYLGTNTNDNANAGNIGESVSSIITSSGAIPLTSGVVASITSINLSAGDWDVVGGMACPLGAATEVIATIGSLSTSSNALNISAPGISTGGVIYPSSGTVFGGIGEIFGAQVGPYRISVSSTTTVYMVINSVFNASSMSAYGSMTARRMR